MSTAATVARKGTTIQRIFSSADRHPFDELAWEKRDAIIQSASGAPVFEQKDVEVPSKWSQTATNILASKYFHGIQSTPQRETSAKQVFSRIATTIAEWGERDGYFATPQDATAFESELTWLMVNQYGAFNSPVFFNVGCDRYDREFVNNNWYWDKQTKTICFGNVGYARPQVSACFINSVEDTMDSIMELAGTEVRLFRLGSGSGTNLSPIRGSMEPLSGGGMASGPLSYMKGYDSFAGVIKSGGKTRRAAKMVILNVDHPDIEDFIDCKLREEKKAHALIAAGYDGSGPDAEAYATVAYQNANNSVRVTDEFMAQASSAATEPNWDLKAIKDGRTIKKVNAKALLRKIAEATWKCGDPGMQFDSTINAWHTSPLSGLINASNPCSEYMFLDDSSCNLASLNLLRFYNEQTGEFDVEKCRAAVRIFIIAQDILVDNASYPTEKVARNSHDFRPLGLGYSNLGALLMASGTAYDSDEGRAFAGGITAILTGEAYRQSALLARTSCALGIANSDLAEQAQAIDEDAPRISGACPGWFLNEVPFLKVIEKHIAAVEQQLNRGVWVSSSPTANDDLFEIAKSIWKEAYLFGSEFGFRNSQVTVLAPTGTIGYLMDCDTTGVEPSLGLVTYKKLVGGGTMQIVNHTVTAALRKLGYERALGDGVKDITAYVGEHGTMEGAPNVDPSHYSVFDCAFKSSQGARTIPYMGHIRMMEAVQPFLSGAISKTINMPEEATVEEIMDAYLEAWKRGLKAVAIYRDGSKKGQPVATKKEEKTVATTTVAEMATVETKPTSGPPIPVRHRLPDERMAITHKFRIANFEGFVTIGLYEDGQPGEMFVRMAKQGSTIAGLMDAFATSVSVGLQFGVPLQTYVDKYAHMRFEPDGWTQNPDIGYAKSIMDYLFRWMDNRFLHPKQEALFPTMTLPKTVGGLPGNLVTPADNLDAIVQMGDAPTCAHCGALMVPSGRCHKCPTCGETSSGCS